VKFCDRNLVSYPKTRTQFENRVLMRIFRHKGEEVTGGWRKLHSEEFYNFTLHQLLSG
jgi:hypothetical protein